ncbi:Nn.00g107180.m01.CDS01 [Neocucurbitaria sp. VM-36]
MPGPRILLTGAESLAGSHVLDLLLSDNNSSVRAVVGSPERAYAIQRQYATSTTLDLTVVPEKDLTVLGAFDNAMSDYTNPFQIVIHTLTAGPSAEADCLARFINLETETMIGFLKSLEVLAKEVRRVVIVTSLTPYARWLTDAHVERNPRVTDVSHSSAAVDPEYVLAASQAGDNIVHDAVVRWMRESHARFDVVWITAPSVYGPATRPLETSSDLLEANRRIWNICSNEHRERMETPPYGIAHFLDVRDLALASVRATFTALASNRRFIISAGTMPSGSDIARFLIACFPEFHGRVRMNGYRSLAAGPSLVLADTHLTASLLGLSQYHTAKQTLADTARQILDLQQRKDWRRVIQS